MPLTPPRPSTSRFVPGTLLAGRYRIVALLGKGGMGEVYRAEDTKLGTTVAVKFLPDAYPEAIDRLYSEVRLGRQVTHRNVCRVHDVFEADGHHFLSMEYVDGEDLGSLLRRIGHLPVDKAVELFRDMCAGLAAAHEQGVLHRDLKPANVMIDGRGEARIADFGVAAATEADRREVVAGTPAYMAPEQLDGQEASARSDLYALGLVAYEMLTGRRLFAGRTVAELKSEHARRTSVIGRQLPDLAGEITRIVQRCLEEEPALRPASAREVMAALPGGDPLLAAVAAGETPSPAMVAAARVVGDLDHRKAWTALASVVVSVLIAAALSDRVFVYRQVPFDKSPEVLAERARQIVASVGPAPRPVDSAYWFHSSPQFLTYLAAQDSSPQRFSSLRTAGRQAMTFVYRQALQPLVPQGTWLDWQNPPFDDPGMAIVVLGTDGLLCSFAEVPSRFTAATEGPSPTTDWAPLLAAAGFESTELEPTTPRWTPPVDNDTHVAWKVRSTDPRARPVSVEAASRRGHPVFFNIIWAWDVPTGAPPPSSLFGSLLETGFFAVTNITALIGALVLARRNLKLRRSDRTGATRIALIFVVCGMASRMLWMHHVRARSEWDLIERHLAAVLMEGAKVWLFYLALEPFVRRRWPMALVGWSRLLAGRLGDPLVGRDVLLGSVFGTAAFLVWQLAHFLPAWFGAAPLAPLTDEPALASVRVFASRVVDLVPAMLSQSLINLFVLVLYRIVVRDDRLAYVLMVLNFVVFGLWLFPMSDQRIAITALAIMGILIVFVLVRFGLLALAGALLFLNGLRVLPVTLDLGSFYAGESVASLAVLLGVAVFAFKVSLAGKPVLGRALEA